MSDYPGAELPADRLDQIEEEVALLRAQIDADAKERREVLVRLNALLPALEAQQERWRQTIAGIVENLNASTAVGEARQTALLPIVNHWTERQQRLEVEFHELRDLGVKTFDIVKLLADKGK